MNRVSKIKSSKSGVEGSKLSVEGKSRVSRVKVECQGSTKVQIQGLRVKVECQGSRVQS